MGTCDPPQSSLDETAAEFVPCEDLVQRLNKRFALNRLREMIEPIFEGEIKNFDLQLDQMQQAASTNALKGSCLIGELLADAMTTTQERTTVGFRFFMKLRKAVSDCHREDLETGLTNCVHEIVRQFIAENSLQLAFLQLSKPAPPASNTSACKEAGDVPPKVNPLLPDRLFGVLSLLRLLITRLNLTDNPDERVCIPPLQPCMDLCRLFDSVCRLQLSYDRTLGPDDSDDRYSPMNIFRQKDWIGLLYQLFDAFSQCLLCIDCLLVNASCFLNGTWDQSGNREQFGGEVELLDLLSTVLGSIRQLLLDERLPLKLLRTNALELLLCVNQVLNSAQMTFRTWSAAFDDLGAEPRESEDEVTESFEQFLEETNQLNPL